MYTRNILRVATGLYKGVRHFSKDFPHIEKIINNEKVVVFMKGTPADPSCGFSSAVVQILKMWNVKYGHINVLEDEQIRQDIKTFSNWPTIPQVYINGQFIGGCDILLEMHNNGQLKETLQKANLLDGESIAEKKGSPEEGKNEEKSSK